MGIERGFHCGGRALRRDCYGYAYRVPRQQSNAEKNPAAAGSTSYLCRGSGPSIKGTLRVPLQLLSQ